MESVEVGPVDGKGSGRKLPLTTVALQSEVMRLADEYAATVAQACDDFVAKVATPEARAVALRWKLSQATAAFVNGAGQTATVNALDMVVLASLSRMVVESNLVVGKFGEPARAFREVYRQLESNAWQVVSRTLTPGQQQELAGMIEEWSQKHPNDRYVGAVRFRQFVAALGRMPVQDKTRPNNLLGVFYLDPLAGLDPTARAIEETRYLGERAIYYAERTPMLLSWQAELLTYQLAVQPETREVLNDASRLSSAAEALGKTAAELPKLITDQREAALKQLFEGVATERSNILASLASEEKSLRDLLPEVRRTLSSGNDMAASVNAAVKSLDAFVHYVSPPETSPPVVSTNSKPFDVLDYGKAATEVGTMARDLNVLLGSVNQSTAQMARLGQQTAAEADRVLHRAFWLGLGLVFILLAGAVLAGLAYRLIASKWAAANQAPSLPNPGPPSKGGGIDRLA
jgi:hypothetical protein